MNQGPFADQQKELINAFETLKESVRTKIEKIRAGPLADNEKNSFKQELNRQVEQFHLMASSYFGDCDNRKQQIEALISEQVDVSDFKDIAAQITS